MSVGTILFSIYFLLGGFKEIKIIESRNNIYSIAGKKFTGRMKSDTLRNYFDEIKGHILDNNVQGELCIVNFRSENLKDDHVSQFIGIVLDNEISEIPSGLSVMELQSDITLKTALTMHPLVRPNPDKIEGLMHAFAQKNGYELQELSLEILYSDNSVMVEMFAKM